MKDLTCQERIRDQYASRLEYLKELFERMNEGDDDATDELYEFPLSVEIIRKIRIDLSTGGPGDWFEATLDDKNRVTNIEYHFNDWFDHAELSVDNPEVEQFIDFFSGALY